jgi:RPA family protein
MGAGPASAADLTDGDFDFTISGTTATITDYADSGPKDVAIPADVTDGTKTYDVTVIGDNAFTNKQLTSVTIPDSVITIGESAFDTNLLQSVTIPDSVTTIGYAAFYQNELKSVTIPDSVTTISDFAFTYNLLQSVTIPDSVTTIGYAAFYQNELTSVTIPDSVTTISESAFSNNQLTSVTIPDSVTSIGYSAFYKNELTSVTIPDLVTTIGGSAFRANRLTSVTIGDSVIIISEYAFDLNPDLVSVVFNGNAPTVTDADKPGEGGESFDTANVSLVLSYPFDATGGFSTPTWHGYTTQVTPQAPVVTTGPSDVSVEAGDDASFTAGASGFPTPTMQWQVDTGTGFVDLTGKTSATLSLPDVTAGMDANKYRAVFSNTSGPNATTAAATLTVTPATDGPFTFTTSDGNATIIAYDNTGPKNVVIPATVTDGTNTYDVTSIGDSAFASRELASVTIPDSVTTISRTAFYDNELASVTIPDSVTTIGDDAFYNNQLTSVTIGDSVTTIGVGAFYNNQLESVTIPGSVTTISDGAFNSNELTSVTIGDSVTTIGDDAFNDNPDLVSVVFTGDAPTTVTDAGDAVESFDTASGSLVVSYQPGATGFTTPSWHGYTVEAPAVTGLAPTITGLAQVGHTLSADPGPVNPADATLTYQWNADGDPISDATGSTYELTTAQAGQTITVTITAAAQGLDSQTETSDPTAVVDAADTTPETPTDPDTTAPTDAALPDTGGTSRTILALGIASILAGALTLTTTRRSVTHRH